MSKTRFSKRIMVKRANDELPTSDKLPLIPYHRESLRIKGLVRFTLNHITDPFTQAQKLYRTSIAVGDYPIDHHHGRYPEKGYAEIPETNTIVTLHDLLKHINVIGKKDKLHLPEIIIPQIEDLFKKFQFGNFNLDKQLSRAEAAVLIDWYLNPFQKEVDIEGNYINYIKCVYRNYT